MNDHTPEQSTERARTHHPGSGAQHLPAHSITLRSSTKARDSGTGTGEFETKRHIDTGNKPVWWGVFLAPEAYHFRRATEKQCGSKTSSAHIKLTHSPRVQPKPWCLHVNPAHPRLRHIYGFAKGQIPHLGVSITCL